ncbi:hypothetical protein ACFX2I_031162 [Malus domestica]
MVVSSVEQQLGKHSSPPPKPLARELVLCALSHKSAFGPERVFGPESAFGPAETQQNATTKTPPSNN